MNYRCGNCNWRGSPVALPSHNVRPSCPSCGARLRRDYARPRVDPFAGVELAYHLPFEGWELARLVWSPADLKNPTWATAVELSSLLLRRVVARRRPMRMEPEEVLAALSGLPAAELEAATFRRLKGRPDNHMEPRSSLTLGGYEFLARSPLVAAVVAAAQVTRRPNRALSALAARLLVEGRAVARPRTKEK